MIPVYVKRKMLMTIETHNSLVRAGFKVIPISSDDNRIDSTRVYKDSNRTTYNYAIWNWGWYGGELYAPIVLNNPSHIRETSVRGCFEKYSDLMPQTSLTPEDLECDYIICKNNGMKGRGKVVCRRDMCPSGYEIYQEWLGTDREEYRALMIGDKRIVSYRKLLSNKRDPQTDKIYKMCGGQRSGESPLPKPLRKLAREVMRRSDLDILGLDLMITGEGKAILTELNSAPGIGEYTGAKIWNFLQEVAFSEE